VSCQPTNRQLRNVARSPSTRIASAWPTGPAAFSNVSPSAVKSSASICAVAVRNVPIGFPSVPGTFAWRSNVTTVFSASSPTRARKGFSRWT